MNRRRPAAVSVATIGLAFATWACGENRASVGPPPETFTQADAGECLPHCSLDGRSVIHCSGEVETCAIDLACGAGRCQAPCAAATAEGSSNGCDFYLQPPLMKPVDRIKQSCYAAYIVNTSTIPVNVSLEFEDKPIDASRSMYRTVAGEATLTQHEGSIPPGEGVILFVSDGTPGSGNGAGIACPPGVAVAKYYDLPLNGTELGSSFHLSASAPVSAAAIFPFGGASTQIPSATLLLPVSTWSKENILINAWEASISHLSPGLQIVASESDTDVTIVPKHAIQDGVGVVGTPAGVPATYRLQKGQFLQLVQDDVLTGSLVTSTKPIGTFGGHVCALIPSDVPACDVPGTQIPAYGQWGSEYVGVGYRPRALDEHEPMPYRIVAAKDGTLLDYDPAVPRGAPLELNAGDIATFAAGVGDAFVVRTQDAEHPIYMAAYMTGEDGDYWGRERRYGGGDPEFVNMVPSGQYLNAASFYADPTYDETSLVIVRTKTDGAFKDVFLECLGGPIPGFTPIGTRGDYEFARVDISHLGKPAETHGAKKCYYGASHLRSEGAFTATLWGWASYASYAYPSGMATRKLVKAPLITR